MQHDLRDSAEQDLREVKATICGSTQSDGRVLAEQDLGEVEAAIEEGTQGELPRLGKARPCSEAAGQHPMGAHPAPMALQLHHILTGVRPRGQHAQQ